MNNRIKDKEQLHSIIASSSVIIFKCLASDNYPLLYVSDNVEPILGFSPNELVDQKIWSDRIHEEDHQRIIKSFHDVTEKRDKAVNEYRFQKKNGNFIWLRDEIKYVENGPGEQGYIVGASFDITDRKNTELALVESQDKYRNVVENIKEVIFQIDEQGRWTYLNPAWEELTGYKVDETLGEKFSNYLHHENPETSKLNIRSMLRSNTDVFHDVTRYTSKDGKIKWVEVLARFQFDENDKVYGVTGILTDVTKKEQEKERVAELNRLLERIVNERTQELHQINQKLRAEIQKRSEAEQQLITQRDQLLLLEKAFSEIEDLVILIKHDLTSDKGPEIIYVNDVYEKKIGYSKNEILGKSPNVLLGRGANEQKIRKIYHELIQKGEVKGIEAVNYSKDGQKYWVNIDIILFQIDDPNIRYAVSISRDITDVKLREIQIRESAQKYRTLVDQSFDAILEISLDWDIIECNYSACHFFGYEYEELKHMKVTDLMVDEVVARLPAQYTEELTTGNEIRETYKKKKDGTIFPVEFNTKMVESNGKKKVIAYIRDITERKRREDLIQWQYEILEMIARRDELSAILNKIAIFIEKQVPVVNCTILLLNKFQDHFRVGAAPGMPEGFIQYIENSKIYNKGTSKDAALKRKTIVTPNITSHPSWKKTYKRYFDTEIRSVLSTPIFSSQSETLGVLTLYQNAGFSEENLNESWIHVATNLAGIAIERTYEHKKLIKGNKNLANAQRIAKMGSWEWDIKRDYVHWSDELYNIFEIDKKRPVRSSTDFLKMLPQEKVAEINRIIEEKVEKKERIFKWHFFLKGKSGEEKYLFERGEIIYDEEGYPDKIVGVIQDITDRYKISLELAKLSMVASKTSNGIFITNEEGEIEWYNDAFKKLTGYNDQEIIGKIPGDLLRGPKTDPEIARLLDEKREKYEHVVADILNYKKDKSSYWSRVEVSPFSDVEEKNKGTINIYTDITALLEYEEELKTSLHEKEVLLTEIHHRVKNNLAVISGLLELQMLNSEHKQVRKILSDSQSRVKSIALIHEKLYHSETLSKIHFANYIQDLIETIRDSFRSEYSSITVNRICDDDIYLNVNQAVPCGLMLNELIINSYQHAFTDLTKGKIDIEIKNSNENIIIVVRDNGIGLPDDFDVKKSQSLGLTLINTLIKQLKGSVSIDNSNGTKFVVTFPWEIN